MVLSHAVRHRLMRRRYDQALASLARRGVPAAAVLTHASRHCLLFGTTAKAARAAWTAQQDGSPHNPAAAWRWYRAIITAAMVSTFDT